MAAVQPEEGALLDDLTWAVGKLLPPLESFTKFDRPERTAIDRAVWSAKLDEPLPMTGAGAEEVLRILGETVIPNGLRIGAPGFSGWVATMPSTVPLAAHLASAAAGPLCVGIQSFNFLEELALKWLAGLLGLPSSFKGVFTSGGSLANLIGLGAARQHAGERRGLDPARDGVLGLPNPRIYATDQVHHCIHRAAGVLGFGRRALVTVPTNDRFEMDPAALRQQIQDDLEAGCTPIAVVASAGTISSGAVDPLPEISRVCRDFGVWFHVDGAYGLLGVLEPSIAHLYGGLDAVDSMVVDPQKWLTTSMGCGCVFVRGHALMERTYTLGPAVYIEGSQPVYFNDEVISSQFDDFGYVFHQFSIEHSLPSRGVEVWAVLKEIGVEGLRARISRHIRYAHHLAERVRQAGDLELCAPVTLSTCCFRYVPEALRNRRDPQVTDLLNTLNRRVLGRMRARGRCMPSGTSIGEAFVIRPCFINPRTTLADVEAHADEARICGAEVWGMLGTQAATTLSARDGN
jgi:glutamate/tyrosine decarboxylase-like PLP-dependent enzyme